jgi:hypothetical protein
VAELADAPGLGPGPFGDGGSNPLARTLARMLVMSRTSETWLRGVVANVMKLSHSRPHAVYRPRFGSERGAPFAVVTVPPMGKFITWRSRQDKRLQEQVLAEARHLYETETPLSTATDRLIEMAGGNPNAFGLAGADYQTFVETPEGKVITTLMLSAEAKRSRGMIVPADSWWPGGD